MYDFSISRSSISGTSILTYVMIHVNSTPPTKSAKNFGKKTVHIAALANPLRVVRLYILNYRITYS